MNTNTSRWNYNRFYVIGAMKSGTSTLCHLLDQHPAICLSNPKESEFFSENFQKGWPWYDALFEVDKETRLLGDGSTGYSKCHAHPRVADMIADCHPGAKIIYIVRNPFERITSQWSHKVRMNNEHLPFEKAIRTSPGHLETSRYWRQISKYREVFSDDQIMILFLNEMQSDPAGTLARCFSFLDIPPFQHIETQGGNQNVAPTEMTMEHNLVRLLKKVPGKEKLYSIIPSDVKAAIKSMLRKPVEVKPALSTATRQWIEDELKDDITAFLEYSGKPADYWLKN